MSFILLFISCNEDETLPDPSPGRMIKSFKLAGGQLGNAIIKSSSTDDGTVEVKVSSKADLTNIIPNIIISEGSTIEPASGMAINITSTREQKYVITAASGQKKEWVVRFDVVSSSLGDYGTFLITSSLNEQLLQIKGDILQNEKYWDKAQINLEPANSSGNELWKKWHIIYNSTVGGVKFYKIENLFSGKFLSVPVNDIDKSGTVMEQVGVSYEIVNQDETLWSIDESPSGGFRISNKRSGMVLTNKVSTVIGGINLAVQEATNDTKNQMWMLTPIARESYREDATTNFFERNESWMGSVAFDQGNSIPLTWGPNAGKVLWVTQDAWDGSSLRNGLFPSNYFFSYNNSVLIQPTATDWNPHNTVNITNPGNPSRPKQIAPNQPGTTWTWPGSGVEIGDKVYLSTGEGNGLNATGSSLIVLTQNAGTAWNVSRIVPNCSLGASITKGDDGYVYAYAPNTSASFGYTGTLHVERAKETNLATWEFWDGNNWTNNETDLKKGPIGNVLGSTSVIKFRNKYIMMTMQQGYNCEADRGAVYIATADSPTGPFTKNKKVYQITEYLKAGYVRYYTPIIHPHADNGKNELLLTYSVNFGSCDQDANVNGFMDPYYYRDKSIRVPYEMIGL